MALRIPADPFLILLPAFTWGPQREQLAPGTTSTLFGHLERAVDGKFLLCLSSLPFKLIIMFFFFFKGKAKMYGLEGVKALRLYLAAPKETRVLKSSSSTV